MTTAAEPPSQPVIPEWSVADRLRKIRREHLGKMPGAELATVLGMTPEKYSAWETGRTNPPHRELVSVARRLELMTGVPAAWTLGVDVPAQADGSSAFIRTPIGWKATRKSTLHLVPPLVAASGDIFHTQSTVAVDPVLPPVGDLAARRRSRPRDGSTHTALSLVG